MSTEKRRARRVVVDMASLRPARRAVAWIVLGVLATGFPNRDRPAAQAPTMALRSEERLPQAPYPRILLDAAFDTSHPSPAWSDSGRPPDADNVGHAASYDEADAKDIAALGEVSMARRV